MHILPNILAIYCNILCIVYWVALNVFMCVLGDSWTPILLQYIVSHLCVVVSEYTASQV
jgi:hypothetical protein